MEVEMLSYSSMTDLTSALKVLVIVLVLTSTIMKLLPSCWLKHPLLLGKQNFLSE